MSEYDKYLAEHMRLREAMRLSECNNGRHNFQHCYNFARCTLCNHTISINTITENQQS